MRDKKGIRVKLVQSISLAVPHLNLQSVFAVFGNNFDLDHSPISGDGKECKAVHMKVK